MKSKVLSIAILAAAAGIFPAVPAAAQEATTMEAEVIDLACYLNQGLKGEGHRECAQVCADAGLPLGFLGSDGNVYFATGEGMPAPSANDILRPHAEHTVTVEGVVSERSGSRSIVVQKVSM